MAQQSVYQKVKDLLVEFEDVVVDMPQGGSVRIIDDLKQRPRTGKACRIDSYNLMLPKRSVYDHVVSLGRQADILMNGRCFEKKKVEELAEVIAYHDLSEAIIGDVPFWTPKELAGSSYMSHEDKKRAEADANRLISARLPDGLSKRFESALEASEQVHIDHIAFFQTVDKIDAIIGIWRYVAEFKDTIDVGRFVEAMNDFFEDERIVERCFSEDHKKLARVLRDKNFLTAYFYDHGVRQKYPEIDFNTLSSLVVTEKMHYV